jgi:hypothetical protein
LVYKNPSSQFSWNENIFALGFERAFWLAYSQHWSKRVGAGFSPASTPPDMLVAHPAIHYGSQ